MMDKLPDSIISSQDLRMVILDVEAYSRWFAASSVKQRVAGKQAAIAEPPSISPVAASLVRQLSLTSSEALDNIAKNLRITMDSAPAMTITLSAPPTQALKRSLASWCRNNIAPNILVDFRFSAHLLGGMVMQYGSHVHDWSFRRQILEQRGKFAEILHNV